MSLILMIDDSELMLGIVTDILTIEGYEVITAINGQDAVERLEAEWTANQRTPDLILSDLQMPGMDGKELSEELKTQPRYKAIPFVLITGSGISDNYFEENAFDGIIVKPFKLEDLLHCVKRLT